MGGGTLGRGLKRSLAGGTHFLGGPAPMRGSNQTVAPPPGGGCFQKPVWNALPFLGQVAFCSLLLYKSQSRISLPNCILTGSLLSSELTGIFLFARGSYKFQTRHLFATFTGLGGKQPENWDRRGGHAFLKILLFCWKLRLEFFLDNYCARLLEALANSHFQVISGGGRPKAIALPRGE